MKTTIKIVSLISAMILVISCGQEDLSLVDTGVDVLVKNKAGNNLLSESTIDYYQPAQIKLFDFQNGLKTEVINTNGKRFEIVKGENNEPLLRLYPREVKTNGETTMTAYIQWRTNDEDMIESTVEKTHKSSHCNKVKHNGVVKYDSRTASGRRLIEIVKTR